MSRKLSLLVVGVVSLAAQGILFAPARLRFIPRAEQSILIPVLFILILASYFVILNRYPIRSRSDWIFPALQAWTVIGLFALLDGTEARVQEGGFLLTAVITILTTYALYSASDSVP